ncbi:MAG: isopentenyl phosphate kinase family protein [Candidatus Lokiarchaeota archaeon]|nr:isopentenyl phosphate kinase family protein [Candidatus Lokiarchaeota archaeon]
MKKEIILLKLGGSLLTDKNKPYSIRKEIVRNVLSQIIKVYKKIIVIHGGGSFGHPPAKKYQISGGLNSAISNQILGVAETHQSMNYFNSYLVNILVENRYPAITMQSSSIFVKEGNSMSMHSQDIIETILNLGLTPILYGDVIFDKNGSFSIISGDEIIYLLCLGLTEYEVSKVIFTMETDGIYIKDDNNKNGHVLLNDCFARELDSLELADLGQKIDVTGGIKGKIDFIKKICDLNVPVQLVNGLKEDYILKALMNQDVDCTNILVNE